jgi:hypothetical protein
MIMPADFFMRYPEDRHFQTLLAALLAILLVMGWVLPHLTLPVTRHVSVSSEPVIQAAVVLPKPMEKMKPIVQATLPPPVEQKTAEVVERPAPIPSVEKNLVAIPQAKPASKNNPPRAAATEVAVSTNEVETVEPQVDTQQAARQQAREQAGRSGLMMMRGQLQQLQQTATQAAPIGAKRAAASSSSAQVVYDEGALGAQAFTQQAVQLSEGAARSGSGAVQHQTRQIAANGAVANQANGYGASSGSAAGKSAAPKKAGVRDEASIRQVFEANKSAIFALYHRALRTQPSLQGKMVFKITISAEGQMTACELVSSQLGDAELEKKLLTKIRMLNFGAQNAAPLTMTYALDFVPS